MKIPWIFNEYSQWKYHEHVGNLSAHDWNFCFERRRPKIFIEMVVFRAISCFTKGARAMKYLNANTLPHTCMLTIIISAQNVRDYKISRVKVGKNHEKTPKRRSLELYFARFSCSWNQENKYHHSNAVTECLEFNFGSIGLTDLKIFSRVYLDTTRRPYEFNLKKIHLPHRAPPKILKDVLFLSFLFQACSNLLIVEMQILLGSFKLSQKEIKTTSAELHCINNIVFKRIIALNEGAV